MPSTEEIILQHMKRIEDKMDKNSDSIAILTTRQSVANTLIGELSRKSDEIKEDVTALKERELNCPARLTYEKRQLDQKNLNFKFGVAGCIATVFSAAFGFYTYVAKHSTQSPTSLQSEVKKNQSQLKSVLPENQQKP